MDSSDFFSLYCYIVLDPYSVRANEKEKGACHQYCNQAGAFDTFVCIVSRGLVLGYQGLCIYVIVILENQVV